MKVLVIGFPRSGTTKMVRLVDAHPSNQHIFIEKFVILNKPRYKQWLEKNKTHNGQPFNWKEDNWCEKIVYESEYHPDFWIRRTTLTPMDYCRKFTKWFGKQARIIHIIRHPSDTWNSLYNMRKGQGKRFQNVPKEIKEYIRFVPTIVKELAEMPNCLTVKYEDIILKPKPMSKLVYEFCGYEWTKQRTFKKLNTTRAFAHKRQGLKYPSKYQFKTVVEAMNKIEGVQYE